MADDVKRVTDMLSAPMEQVIVSLGTGIARAQREIDRFALESQREIAEDPLLADTGLTGTFYQIPVAELELTTAIALEEEPQPPTPAAGPATIVRAPALRRIHLQPVNASYNNHFSFDVNAASKLKLKIVPVPPPGGDGVAPSLTRDRVLEIAKPKLTTDANARVTANFNGQMRTWFVLQYRLEGNAVNRLALVVIDDATGQIVK